MAKSKNKHRKARPRARAAVLEAFTAHDLEVWATRSTDVQAYYDRVYYDLERQRAAHYDELCSALRAVPGTEVAVDGWVRVTDWRWNLAPLSAAGSIKAIGGRFNIGSDLDRARGQAFPWLREQDDVLLSTASCDAALRFAKGLDREERGTTASHLRIVQDAVRDLAIAMTSDPDQRIRALEKQRQAFEREIEELHAGIVVEISPAEQYERLREIYQLASVLTGDFRRLEDEIRQMDHALRVQMIQGDSTRGDVLMAVLAKEGALADTDAGRAFEGFFQLLADDGRTTEFREQLRAILESAASGQLRPDERQFLSRLVRELSRESERVLLVRRRAEENLRAYIESSEFRENRAVARILAELERRAVGLRDTGISASARTRLTLGSGRAELSSVETIRLRRTRVQSKREGATASALRAHYRAEDGADFTLAALWWLDYLLRADSKGYLPSRIAAPLIASGRLHRVEGAPVFLRRVYLVERARATQSWTWYEAAVAASGVR